jgi:sec-independent protein translocase protein TatB
MFDVSFTELLVIGVVALVVIGPERLPKVARTVGHLVGRAQRYVNDVKSDIQREVELDDLRKLKDQMQDAAQSVKTSLADTEASLRKPLESFEQDTMSALKDGSTTDSLVGPTGEALPSPQDAGVAEDPTPPAKVADAALGAEGTHASSTVASTESASPAHAAVTATDSPSAAAQVAAASPTPAAELARVAEPVSAPKQLELDGVVSGATPNTQANTPVQAQAQAKPATPTEHAAANTIAPATATTPKPGTPT